MVLNLQAPENKIISPGALKALQNNYIHVAYDILNPE